ncbi:hypothetical protein DDJ72_04080 [Mycobacteroides abscessus]|uniref:hypothetical protein n=1 Tax=Mycobacteroides abscessus TaxID=36809 RepID=UPI000D3ED2D4|nr:hypothetical protein [Mycobacteroides abscessus]PVA58079.1 hypothetical protein DDJ72_04080 [Mycobacteroides abscessus]
MTIELPDGTAIELRRRYDGAIVIARHIAGSSVQIECDETVAQLLIDNIQDLIDSEEAYAE